MAEGKEDPCECCGPVGSLFFVHKSFGNPSLKVLQKCVLVNESQCPEVAATLDPCWRPGRHSTIKQWLCKNMQKRETVEKAIPGHVHGAL